MSDTHINAYFGDVEEKRKLVDLAEAELEAAEARLAIKKKEVGYVESPPTEVETEAEEVPVQEEVRSGNSFRKR